jgi:flagellar hook-associated protein 1 FlgK
VSANLANALTEGYGRRALDVSSQDLGGQGAGVRVDGTARLVDRAVLADRRGAEARMTGSDALAWGLRALEASLGSVDGGADIAARLRALDGALVLAGTEPASEARLATVLSRLQDVASGLRGSSDAVRAGREAADAAIAREVSEVNAALRGIEALNGDVVRARASGRDAAALLDQRQVLVDRVAARIPVREVEGKGGAVALFTTQGTTLIDGRASVIGFRATPVITAEMTLASGALDELTVKRAVGGSAGLAGGRLAGRGLRPARRDPARGAGGPRRAGA